MRHQDDEPAPCRDRRRSRAGRACGAPRRSSGMAHVEPARRAAKYHNHPTAAQMPRTEPCRERLAVAARQLAVKPNLQILQRHPRSLLSRIEQTRRYALENHVHRSARLGVSVLLRETWYKTQVGREIDALPSILKMIMRIAKRGASV